MIGSFNSVYNELIFGLLYKSMTEEECLCITAAATMKHLHIQKNQKVWRTNQHIS